MAEAVRILYFTREGEKLAQKLQDKILNSGFDQRPQDKKLNGSFVQSPQNNADIFLSEGMSCEIASGRGKGRLHAWTEENFQQGRVMIYIGACGIAVRAIAPFVASKVSDPAVIVIDERGRHVIPILSGHIGGANLLALRLAALLGDDSEAVITTATDINDLPAIDEIAVRNGLVIDDMPRAKAFSAQLLEENCVAAPDHVTEERSGRAEGNAVERAQGTEAAERSGKPKGSTEARGTETAERSGEPKGSMEAQGTEAAERSGKPQGSTEARGTETAERSGEPKETAEGNGYAAGRENREHIGRKRSDVLLKHLLVPDAYSKWITVMAAYQPEDAVYTAWEAGTPVAPVAPVCVISPGIRKSPMPLYLIPKMLVLGVGCRRGKEPEELVLFAREILKKHSLRGEAVLAVASIDIKRDEPAINSLARSLNVPFRTFDAGQLREVPGQFHESEFVQKTTGVGNICERAVIAAGADDILVPKIAENGMTMAVGICRVKIRI